MKRDDLIPITTPKCFHNHSQFTTWMKAARATGGCHEAGFCTDCTEEYKNRMLAAGRCEHPDVRFAPDEHGFIQGVISNSTTDATDHQPAV